MKPILYLVIPCYNEEEVLPQTSGLFLKKLEELIKEKRINNASKILFVNDGSNDHTWEIITKLARDNAHFIGVCLSRNRGHQNALLCGLMEAKDYCDITVSLDCDGQDDLNAVDEMITKYEKGFDIVYGVRSDRSTDRLLKKLTAEGYYKLLHKCGAEVVYNHADYRLLSKRVLDELEKYEEVNLYLRGMIPLVGFASTSVYYSRKERVAGKTHYPFRKMIKLAIDGITSLSVRPIRLVSAFGGFVSLISFVGVIWSVVRQLCGHTVIGWASMTCIICFIGGVQLLSIGILGEYIGKIYLEVKRRPRYIVSERTKEVGGVEDAKEKD